MTMDEAASDLGKRLGVELRRRYTSYGGHYYLWRNNIAEVSVRNNVIDGGELTHPDLPEGVYVNTYADDENMFKQELDDAPAVMLYRTTVFD